jgi:hypothetical protein
MSPSPVRSLLAAALAAAVILAALPARAQNPLPHQDERLAKLDPLKARAELIQRHHELVRILNTPTDKLNRGIDPGTPLRDALDAIAKLHNVNILIDHAAFAREVSDVAVDDHFVQLPPLRDVPLGMILDQLLAQMNPPGVYLVREGSIIVTTPARFANADHRLLSPVNVLLDRVPFDVAMQELAARSGVNILIDLRAGDKAKTPVSATLQRVPLETAVRLLANMADLRAVAVDNTLYVTMRANAQTFNADTAEDEERTLNLQKLRLKRISPAEGEAVGPAPHSDPRAK